MSRVLDLAGFRSHAQTRTFARLLAHQCLREQDVIDQDARIAPRVLGVFELDGPAIIRLGVDPVVEKRVVEKTSCEEDVALKIG